MDAVLSRDEAIDLIMKTVPPDMRAAALQAALEIYGEAPDVDKKEKQLKEIEEKFEPYQFEPWRFIKEILGWTPWSGTEKFPGQVEILEACVLAIRQQIELRTFEKKEISKKDLQFYNPDQSIKNWIRVESGNGIGKTKCISGIVLWFLFAFRSIIYTFSSSAEQDRVTTWKEVTKDFRGKKLPGRILQTSLNISEERFAMSRSPSKSGGKGEENTKGQHNEFLCFIIDEADGAENFIFDAIETMVSGGIYIVVMMANPRKRSSRFHQLKKQSDVKTLRISSLSHPNVVQNQEVIPGAVKRNFIEKEIEKSFKKGGGIVTKHNPEDFTFDLPYSVKVADVLYPEGTIFKPSPEFMTRILGIAPPNDLDNTFVSVGVYEAAIKRIPKDEPSERWFARVGIDAARGGSDNGTFYVRWNNRVWREEEIPYATTEKYIDVIKKGCLKLKAKGVTSLHIRIDAAYASGVIDGLRICAELKEAFDDFKVIEVYFVNSPHNTKDYDNLVTEMYAEAGESLNGLAILNPVEHLEADLTERQYEFVNRKGKTTKALEDKDDFKKRQSGRSPDDGDGLVMAIAPDYCFKPRAENFAPISLPKVSRWR